MDFMTVLLHQALKQSEGCHPESVWTIYSGLNEESALDFLYRLSVEAIDQKLRDQVLNRLSDHSSEACRHFSAITLQSNPIHIRKRAFVNLGLMGCKNARDAVLAGLQDKHPEVALSAALSIGLYSDPEFLRAVELFFECHQFAMISFFSKFI